MQYKISVCVPIYNVEKYFEQCLDSLFTQTMLNGVEFIFVNDCTPDSSMIILQRTLQKYPALREQVVIYNHNQNRGLAAARNTALELSHGEYIIHVDSDDWVEPNYLEELYKTITENNADIAICNCYVWHASGEKEPTYQGFPSCDVVDSTSYIQFAFRKIITPVLWTKLVHRKVYENITWVEGINKGEDSVMTIKLFYNAKKIVYTKKQLYNYRYQVGFVVKQTQEKQIYQDILACQEIENFLKKESSCSIFKKEIEARKAGVRYNYIIHQKWYDIQKYKNYFPEVKLRNISFFESNTSIYRRVFYFLVDNKLFVLSNIYLFLFSFIKK